MQSKTFLDRQSMLVELSQMSSNALGTLALMLRDVQRGGRAYKTAPLDAPYTYLIGTEEDKYITRTLMPRVDDCRVLIHSIHRDDRDPDPHDHPWDEAVFLVVDGGYVDERWSCGVDGIWRPHHKTLMPGSLNQLLASDYHRAIEVCPNTLTLGVVGSRVQEWGFLVDGVKIDSAAYRDRQKSGGRA